MNESEFNKIAVVKISGMTCEGCTMNVQSALTSAQGVKNAKVDLSKKTTVIEFDTSKTNESRLKKVISQAGFDVENNPTSNKTEIKEGLSKVKKAPSRLSSNLRLAVIFSALVIITLIGYLAFRATVPEIDTSTSASTLLFFAVIAGSLIYRFTKLN